MRTASLIDARAGYFVDEAYELIPANGLLKGENCYWRDGLQQRGGHQPYATATYSASDVIRGVSRRHNIVNRWINIEAIDLNASGNVQFYYRATTALRAIDASYTFRTGNKVYFGEIDGKIVAVNGVDKPAIIYYEDAITWTSRTSASARQWFSVCWSPELSLFCAVAYDGTVGVQVMTSPDGTTWTARTSASAQQWRSICWSPELTLFCAVADNGAAGVQVMSSPDGITWTSRTSASAQQWRSVCWSPELTLFCAVAFNGAAGVQVMTSPDGITWTSRTSASAQQWQSVCWSPELTLFCAVSYNGAVGVQVMTSPDGTTWTSRTSASAQEWSSICWSPELALFCAVALNGAVGVQVMTSPDGTTWTSRTSASAQGWMSVCWSPELMLFCAIADNGAAGVQVMTSPDGTTWTSRTSASALQWLSICWSPELSLFCAVAYDGAVGVQVMTSPDGLTIKNLEAYDERDRDETTWNAGQYTVAGTVYTDDTTDAQDAGADDFQLVSSTNGDGFFIACTHTFNKVVLKSAQQAAGSPVAVYEYYADDSTWKSCSMVTTPTWTAAAGDRTIEFNYPSDMGRWDGSESILTNRFMFRVRFTTAPTGAFSCDYATVHHTQYITQITGSDQPHYVIAHNSRLWLAVGYIVYYSPPNQVTGWRGLSESEYFLEGGPEIRSMVSHKGYLVVFKDNAIYAFYGNSLDSFLRKKMADVGIEEILSSVSGGEEVYYLSQDGVRMFNGPKNIRVSKHIKSDIEGFTRTGAVAIYYKGEVWLSFPSESKLLVFDPATMRVDEETGDGAVSFFKFTGYKVDYFINCNGKGDTKKLLAVVNDSTPYIAELETGTNDKDRAGSNVNIDYRFKTNYFALINILQEKRYGIAKFKLKEATAETTYALTLEADGGARTKSANIVVALGTGYYNHVSKIPYELDGYNLAVEIRNNQLQDAGFRGLSLEYEKKEF
ncbi:hypothetical protein LCGC14_0779750 [marine sediment metagenome]|uniref:Photosynthesis system II assembly factor Ycf48/Hcf136-like domain-containing protein n=1 Tax=marine sediment metagenome TaxID=412755 RepID=A0A0F9QFS9_9ZZZZ